MSDSNLNGKRILAVDDEPDVLAVLKDEIMDAAPSCVFETATSYEEANGLLQSKTYDLVVLDIMGVRGFDLLKVAVSRGFKTAMLTAHALTPEALKNSMDLKANAYLPKDKLSEIVPFLQDVLALDYESGWKRVFEKLYTFFTEKFESDWQKKIGLEGRTWV
ncbi:MAG TPA: response regulator [Syntrophorhabdaceae bacterium]